MVTAARYEIEAHYTDNRKLALMKYQDYRRIQGKGQGQGGRVRVRGAWSGSGDQVQVMIEPTPDTFREEHEKCTITGAGLGPIMELYLGLKT